MIAYISPRTRKDEATVTFLVVGNAFFNRKINNILHAHWGNNALFVQ